MTGSTNSKWIGFFKIAKRELKSPRSISTARWRRGRIVPVLCNTFASNDLLDNGHFFLSSALKMEATACNTYPCVVLLSPNTAPKILQTATGNTLPAANECDCHKAWSEATFRHLHSSYVSSLHRLTGSGFNLPTPRALRVIFIVSGGISMARLSSVNSVVKTSHSSASTRSSSIRWWLSLCTLALRRRLGRKRPAFRHIIFF